MSTAPRTVDVSAIINNRRLTRCNFSLILLSWLITMFDGFDMMMVSFTAPFMRDEFGLSTTMLGYVFSAGLFGMMLGSFFFSYLADQVGRRPTIVAAAFLFGILTTATAFARSYDALLMLRFADGLAIGGMLPMAWALNIEFVPTRMRSTIVTIIMIGYSLGTAIAGPLTNLLAPQYGWQSVYLVGGIGTLVCALALWLRLPESIRYLVTKGGQPDLVAAALRRLDPGSDIRPTDRYVLLDESGPAGRFRVTDLFRGKLAVITPLLWLGFIVSSLAIYFSSSWTPIVLESLEFPRSTAANVASLAGLFGAAAGLCLMRFTDRFGARAVAVFPAVAVPMLLIQGFGLTPLGLFLAVNVIASMLISGGHYGMLSLAGIFYPSSIRATGAGWAAAVAKVGAVLGPIIGAVVLSSDLPVIRCYALLATCPAVLFACVIGIHFAQRGRQGALASAKIYRDPQARRISR